MTVNEALFHDLAGRMPETIKGKMFGALCLKCSNNGKAYLMYWNGFMIFKLHGEELKDALKLKNAKIFSPMEDRPMGGWVQLDNGQSGKFDDLAMKAHEYVKKIEK